MRKLPFVLVLVVLFVAACGDEDTPEIEGLPVVDGAPEVRVEATDFDFAPAEITLTAGEAVNIVLVSNQGGHNLVVPDAGYQLPIVDEGEQTRGALTMAAPGTYDFVCSVPGHIDEGMVGTIVVEAAG